ncbi:hypothetical protein [Hyphococcus luteus]|uniref:hypothetical protein n=1 Tax=Hyphococcus luteus TaxID=2058213 RepID=UPI001056E9B8|nr:hypothetical protein [Marinicaulis flavus]
MTKPAHDTGRALVKASQGHAATPVRARQLPELVTAEVVMDGRQNPERMNERVSGASAVRTASVCNEQACISVACLALAASWEKPSSETRSAPNGFMEIVETVMRGSDIKSTVSIEM